MEIKKIFQAPIRGYQFFSRLFPASCRYYPSCSEYAKWQFAFNRPDRALRESALRILRCNQLFIGGIDYPRVLWSPPPLTRLANPIFRDKATLAPLFSLHPPHRQITIQYWIIPQRGREHLIIKAFDE